MHGAFLQCCRGVFGASRCCLRGLKCAGEHCDDDDYDPVKEQYVERIPEDAAAEMEFCLRQHQAERLRSAVARRRHEEGANEKEGSEARILKHYELVAEELSPCSSPERRLKSVAGKSLNRPDRSSCPVCLEADCREAIVELACGHMLCSSCGSKCAASGLRSCPVCRFPHLLDPIALAERSAQWRGHYAAFRTGLARGAHGEAGSICDPRRGAAVRPLPDVLLVAGRSPSGFRGVAAYVVLTSELAGDLVVARDLPQPAERRKTSSIAV